MTIRPIPWWVDRNETGALIPIRRNTRTAGGLRGDPIVAICTNVDVADHITELHNNHPDVLATVEAAKANRAQHY